MSLLSLILVLLAGLNSCIGNLLLKNSRLRLTPGAGWMESFLSPWFLGGLFFYFVNVLLFAKALDTAPVSVAYPILATAGFLMLAVAAQVVFQEKLSPQQWAGLLLAIGGIVLLSQSHGSPA